MKCNVLITDEYQWKKISRNKVDIFFKGCLDNSCITILLSLPFKDDNFIQQYISTMDVNFAFVVSAENFCIMSVDKIRSIPIIYSNISNTLYVDCKSSRLLEFTESREVDNNSILSIAMSGYTIGDNTFYKSIKALVAGQLVIVRNSCDIKKIQYYQYMPELNNDSEECLECKLEKVTLDILKKTIGSLKGRQAVIPLSAGNDSRLIASGFKHLGYENVKCYSYGFENFESDTSKIIANKLGYEWKLVELNIKEEKKFYKSRDFEKYLDFSDV